MNIKPILFNTEMVRAILDGRKTVTRRIVKPQPKSKLCYTYAGSHKKYIGKWGYPGKNEYEYWGEEFKLPDDITEEELKKEWNPPYHADDILYVRETWSEWTGGYIYKAWTGPFPQPGASATMKWHPAIHMPKEAARLFLRVKDVHVERLQEITDEQAEKEGCSDYTSTALGFCYLWDSTIRKSDLDYYGWAADPWVWVIEFERCEQPSEWL